MIVDLVVKLIEQRRRPGDDCGVAAVRTVAIDGRKRGRGCLAHLAIELDPNRRSGGLPAQPLFGLIDRDRITNPKSERVHGPRRTHERRFAGARNHDRGR